MRQSMKSVSGRMPTVVYERTFMRPEAPHSEATRENWSLPCSRSFSGSLRHAGSTLKNAKFTNCRLNCSSAIGTSAVCRDSFILPFDAPVLQGSPPLFEETVLELTFPGLFSYAR